VIGVLVNGLIWGFAIGYLVGVLHGHREAHRLHMDALKDFSRSRPEFESLARSLELGTRERER